MTLLLDRGSPVDVRSSEGVTPLMNAVESHASDRFSFLIEHGADVKACDRRGFSALHRAAERGHLEMARMLLDHGASPSLDAEGHTPRSLAEARGETSVVALLDKYLP